MTHSDFHGIFPILVTPFNETGELDLKSLKNIINTMNLIKVDGITVLGVLGESNRLIERERDQIISEAVRVADGKIPVIVGTSFTGTHATSLLSTRAEQFGASAVMITPHAEPIPDDNRILEMFKYVDSRITIPIVIQDHPASTNVHMSPDLLFRLIKEVPGIVCIKQEATPTPPKIRRIIAELERTNQKVSILTGLGALYGQFDLESGSNGFMTGFAFPEILQAMLYAKNSGDLVTLQDLYNRFLPLIVYEQQPGLAIRKEIFKLRGLIESSHVRHPGKSIDASTSSEITKLLDNTLANFTITEPLNL